MSKKSSFSHINERGEAQMVDIHRKEETWREATACASVSMTPELLRRLADTATTDKGDVWAAARIAGIAAAKQTDQLIPLCHRLALSKVDIRFDVDTKKTRVVIVATCGLWGRSGAEMEALTAVSVAALTLYDMCKALDKTMVISDIMLLDKRGGKSGHYQRAKPSLR
ncbi:MAG: cyclic pyranopterin monophosphate synthase MoaC [Alphaproteobacteria bacterium GM202ARS2]|nr:cyclic pyranopterin monophosphate synthase MoaC [Alphaproteobacteria bacterium GM202ARS2]